MKHITIAAVLSALLASSGFAQTVSPQTDNVEEPLVYGEPPVVEAAPIQARQGYAGQGSGGSTGSATLGLIIALPIVLTVAVALTARNGGLR